MIETIMNRRTIRRYKDKKIEKEKMDLIIKAALTSPSGRNLKPIDLIVTENKNLLNKLSKSRGKYSQWIDKAPAGFVLVADESSTTWISDASIMATIIQLTGESLGLSSCWIHAENRIADDGSDMENNIKQILDIPEDKRILCMISIGYPDEIKKSYDQEDLDFSSIHIDKY